MLTCMLLTSCCEVSACRYGANFISQYCGETVGNELFNVGEYWADLRRVPCSGCLAPPWPCCSMPVLPYGRQLLHCCTVRLTVLHLCLTTFSQLLKQLLCSYGGEGLEHNQNGPRQELCDWLDKAGGCTLFDFPTKGILAEAVEKCQYWRLRDSEGKPPGLLGW